VSPYQVILHPQAWQILAATQGAARRRLLSVLDQVATDPFRAGDMRQQDAAGRMHEIALLGEWLVTYWADHAVREIRIVALERPDDGP
jgi:hypothetical protein